MGKEPLIEKVAGVGLAVLIGVVLAAWIFVGASQ